MKTLLTGLVRVLITLLLLGLAFWVGKSAWDHYMDAPWTRDGRVKADIINISADVSGIVTEVMVKDDQLVHKGDVLFTVDKARYVDALAQADAVLAAQRTEIGRRSTEAKRRALLDSSVVSTESRETADFAVNTANAQFQAAQAARNLAQVNLERTVIRAPATGYVTNLRVYVGDFAAVGAPKLAVIDSASFYVVGYFEETKLERIRLNDQVEMTMLGSESHLRGHVESVARGITDRDATTGRELLADVNPTFNWVRLAQRVPVRIHIDSVPAGQVLVAGTTCTIVISNPAAGGKQPTTAPAMAPATAPVPATPAAAPAAKTPAPAAASAHAS
jgi:multidrug resistance efflux pump